MVEEAGKEEGRGGGVMPATRATRLEALIRNLSKEVADEWFRMLSFIPDNICDGEAMSALYAEFDYDTEADLGNHAAELVLRVARMRLLGLMGEEEREQRLEQIMGDF